MGRKPATGTKDNYAIGWLGLTVGVALTARRFNCSVNKVKYWRRKILDDSFHPKQHGGRRKLKYGLVERAFIELILWDIVSFNPMQHISDFRRELRECGWDVSSRFIKKIFKDWRWSWKKPQFKQLNKYTAKNVAYYADFISWIHTLPNFQQLKFLDEVHFMTKDVARQRAIAPIGKNVIVLNSGGINAETYSVTALIQINDTQPVIVSPARETSNNQLDFLEFLLVLIENNHLVAGDILVLDNASVHAGLDSLEMLYDLLYAAGVKLVFLPTYSPELNPIELVFMWVKRFLRENRTTEPLWFDIAAAFALIDINLVTLFYKRCLYSF